ncbi:arylsulfatase [Sesbania bispinosa]|nr:arylsulfatase [Sesbania bispinosa]
MRSKRRNDEGQIEEVSPTKVSSLERIAEENEPEEEAPLEISPVDTASADLAEEETKNASEENMENTSEEGIAANALAMLAKSYSEPHSYNTSLAILQVESPTRIEEIENRAALIISLLLGQKNFI